MIVYTETEGCVVQAFDTETKEFVSSEFIAGGEFSTYFSDDGKYPTSYDVPEELEEMVHSHYFGYDMVQPSPPKRKKKAKATRKKKTKRKKSKS